MEKKRPYLVDAVPSADRLDMTNGVQFLACNSTPSRLRETALA